MTPGMALANPSITMLRIPLWVKAGSATNAIGWDPWRKCWVVSCREPPTGGRANRAVAALIADWLELPHASVRWTKAGSSRSKMLSVTGITEDEIVRRLRSHVSTATLGSQPP